MGNFNRDRGSRGGGRSSFGERRSFGGNSRGGYSRGGRDDKQMFSAVCSNCGNDCQVPFRPSGDKPIYCSACFEKMGGRGERRSFDRPRRDDRGGANDNLGAQFEALNAKLDKILNFLQPKEVVAIPSPVEAEIKETVKKEAVKKETKPVKPKKSSTKKAPKETK